MRSTFIDHNRLDVLLPVRNGERYLADSIRGLQSQTFTSWHLIVINNGSTDSTQSILEDFVRTDSRIEVVHQVPSGLVAALNAGLHLCRTEFVARHDADDVSCPGRFQLQIDYMGRHPTCVCLSGGYRTIDVDGRPLSRHVFPTREVHADLSSVPAKWPRAPQPFMMARRDALMRINGYRHFFPAEDVDLCWRLSEIGGIANLPDVIGAKRLHSESVSATHLRAQVLYGRLADVAAQRRRWRHCDLDLEPSLSDRLIKAVDFPPMIRMVHSRLTSQEFAYLSAATAIRYLQRNEGTPANLEASDLRFASNAIRLLQAYAPTDFEEMRRVFHVTKTNLIALGREEIAQELLI